VTTVVTTMVKHTTTLLHPPKLFNVTGYTNGSSLKSQMARRNHQLVFWLL
jgi:hypothetical protein